MKTTPQKRNPLPQHELQIGKNLRRWRELKGLKRKVIARAIKETDEKLASYEEGRAPLSWIVFLKLWGTYDVNPRFLATSLGSEDHPFPILRSLIPQAPGKARFSEVYARELEATFDAIARHELPGHIKDLERFVALAKADAVDASAVRIVALTAHKNHTFPKSIIIGSDSGLTRREKTAQKAVEATK